MKLPGDLTFLHDAGSLAVDEMDGKLNIQVIVGNDNGGSIFEGLEVAQVISSREFDRLFRTPQRVNLERLARAYGWEYIAVSSAPELKAALKIKGRVVIEVPVAG
jgi:2-succinyl-5-enolpyruvyl-6-hydroxy-3-cyclohexene-1-carboxylate synthase